MMLNLMIALCADQSFHMDSICYNSLLATINRFGVL